MFASMWRVWAESREMQEVETIEVSNVWTWRDFYLFIDSHHLIAVIPDMYLQLPVYNLQQISLTIQLFELFIYVVCIFVLREEAASFCWATKKLHFFMLAQRDE